MTALVVYFAFALVVSFLCSILESALLSVTPSHLAKLEQDRPKIGRKVRAMKSHISRCCRPSNVVWETFLLWYV